MAYSIINSTQSTTHACCQQAKRKTLWTDRINTICRIAIGVFAAFVQPHFLTISFTAGMIGGIAYALYMRKHEDKGWPQGSTQPVCAQGYLDFLSDTRFPAPLPTLATAAFIIAHMRHDPLFYVPFCGGALGFLAGKQSVSLIHK